MEYLKKQRNDVFETKSHSFTNGAKNNVKKHAFAYDDELDVRFVNDIDSLVPPKYNPDTRTYFKISIYSPSNRLYTVNEEVNSTQSDMGGVDQFSSSIMNSAYRMSSARGKVNQKRRSSGGKSDYQIIEESMQGDKDLVIEEGLHENDELSDSMLLPETPSPRVGQYVINHTSKGINKVGKFS